jgi:ribokinase
MPVPRIAVIGHVEWNAFASADRPLQAGGIYHFEDTVEDVGGGGGVSARVLPGLGADTRFYTALAGDQEGRDSARILREDGVDVQAADRPGRQNRALIVVEPAGERTILVLGPNEHPTLDDPLPWDDLAGFDAVYFTGDDPRTLQAARRARKLVVTARRLASLIESRVEADVLLGSIRDPAEIIDEAVLPVPPHAIVRTDGANGGVWTDRDGRSGRWATAPVPGPVVDTYGAGDSFAAALTLGLALGEDVPEAAARGAAAAAEQLTRRGGRPRGHAQH